MNKTWKLLSGAVVALALLAAAPVGATTRVNMESTKVDGMEMRKLSCELEKAGFMAMMQVLAALKEQKKALDACVPKGKGAAFSTRWAWAGGEVSEAEVVGTTYSEGRVCVAKALRTMKSALVGKCTAIMLVGEPKEAAAAADTLGKSPVDHARKKK